MVRAAHGQEAAVKEHSPAADPRKILDHLEILEYLVGGQDFA